MGKRRVALSKAEREFIGSYSDDKGEQAKLYKFLSSLKTHTRDRAGSDPNTSEQIRYPTGILAFDVAVGGLTPGLHQLYGHEDTMKSSFVVHMCMNSGKTSTFLNADNKPFRWNPGKYDILIGNGDYNSSRMLKEVINAGIADLIVIDSITALHRGMNALKSAIKLIPTRPEIILFYTNQTRYSRYKQSSQPSGDDRLHSFCNTMISITKVENKAFGHNIYYEVVKPQHEQKKFYICYNDAGNVSNEIWLIDWAIRNKIVTRTGALYKFFDDSMDFPSGRYRLSEMIEDSQVMRQIWEIFKDNGEWSNMSHEQYLERTLTNCT